MVALSKFFLSPIYEVISIYFFKVLPQALRVMFLSALVLWISYKSECSRRRYTALINRQSSTFIYRKRLRPPSLEVMECSICLSEFEEGEEAKELHCKHAFHKNCLEKWLLGGHTTCPLCRSLVVPTEETLSEFRRSQDAYQEIRAGVEMELALMLLSPMTTEWGCHSGC